MIINVVSPSESFRAPRRLAPESRRAASEASEASEDGSGALRVRRSRAQSATAAAPALDASLPGPSCLRSLRPTERFGRVTAYSKSMHELFRDLELLAKAETTVTLIGETGVGKDVLAHGIHAHSARAHGPFVVLDGGAIASNLAESELLGHERGSFTGAVSTHIGAFERAHGGVLFLDEVGDLPLQVQPLLLRALESRHVRRVGGQTPRHVDVRVIAATNRNLRADVAAGRFRADLFYRLAVSMVTVPPLRRRLDDLPLLVEGILTDLGHAGVGISGDGLTTLRGHAWPGNVRELKNALACATAFLEPGAALLEARHFRSLLVANDDATSIDRLPLAGQTLENLERAAIRQTVEQASGNKMSAARSLGIAVSTLYEKLRKYDL